MKVVLPALVLLLAVAACTATPEAGEECDQEGAGVCETSALWLQCDGGKYRAIPCRGPAGCTEGSSQLVCDTSKARAGDACPSSQQNLGQCDASNANSALVCRAGTWAAAACKACAVQGDAIVCQP